MNQVESRRVEQDEAGMRLDRWFRLHFPGLGFASLQKLLRSGQIRIDGARAKAECRLAAGQAIRLPPPVIATESQATKASTPPDSEDSESLSEMLLHRDEKLFVFNKPAGLAVQGGSGIARHIDAMLEAWRNEKGEKPKLVHRLDRETSGILVVARGRSAAADLTRAFRKRETVKTYWAICKGVPRKPSGRISTWLVRDGERMRVARHGESGADHAESLYETLDSAGRNLSWLSLTPISGRTHQLRVHMAHIGCPIIGDSKYFPGGEWKLPGGIQNRLHLHARRIRIPHPDGGALDISAPLPPHMRQTFNLLGFSDS